MSSVSAAVSTPKSTSNCTDFLCWPGSMHPFAVEHLGTNAKVHHQVPRSFEVPQHVFHSRHILLLWPSHHPFCNSCGALIIISVMNLFSRQSWNSDHQICTPWVVRLNSVCQIVVDHLQRAFLYHTFSPEMAGRSRNGCVEEVFSAKFTTVLHGMFRVSESMAFCVKKPRKHYFWLFWISLHVLCPFHLATKALTPAEELWV